MLLVVPIKFYIFLGPHAVEKEKNSFVSLCDKKTESEHLNSKYYKLL